MSPWDRIVAAYVERGLERALAGALDYHLQHGFVFSTPEFFIMGHPKADAWFIEAMAGDTGKAWAILPYELPYVEFYRFDNCLHRLPLSFLKRVTKHEPMAPA